MILSCPILLLIVSTNYYFDPAYIFHHDIEDKMIKIILNGQNVTNCTDFDERSLVSKIPKAIDKAPNILVLGSSRINYIRQEYFNNKTLINANVSSASLMDIVINYQFFKHYNRLPDEKIIIGIDPWFFNNNNPEYRWKRYKSVFQDFIDGEIGLTYKLQENPISYYFQLASLSYFQSSLKSAQRNVIELIPTDLKYNKGMTVMSDFSKVGSKLSRDATLDEVREKANNYFSMHGVRINTFNEISIELTNLFENLINDIIKNNIDVELLIIPYHPKVYEIVESDFPNIIKTENILNDLANKHKVSIFGSFNPSEIEFDETDFLDGLHCTENAIKKLTQRTTQHTTKPKLH